MMIHSFSENVNSLSLVCLLQNTKPVGLVLVSVGSQTPASTDSKQCYQTNRCSQMGAASKHGGWSLPVASTRASLCSLYIFSTMNPPVILFTMRSTSVWAFVPLQFVCPVRLVQLNTTCSSVSRFSLFLQLPLLLGLLFNQPMLYSCGVWCCWCRVTWSVCIELVQPSA